MPRAGDRVAEAFHAARMHAKAGGMTMQEVEDATRELAKTDALYDVVSRSSYSNLENQGTEWFKRNVGEGRIRSLIAVLFENDPVTFERMTGLRAPLIQGAVASGESTLARSIEHALEDDKPAPVYVEGQHIEYSQMLFGVDAREHAPRDAFVAPILVKVQSTRMVPVVFPGQLVGAEPRHQVEPGELALVRRRNDGLVIAWCIGPGTFLYVRGGERFRLESGDEVAGAVTHVRPHIPLPSLAHAQ